MASIWRPSRGMMAREVSHNLFIFYFFHEVDLLRVIEDGPWSFEQSLLLLQRVEQNESPFDICLNYDEFWVQAHNFPMSLQNRKMAEAIGNFVGEFIKLDTINMNGLWKPFMRVRARLDATKPLKRKMKVKPPKGDVFYIEFKYERLTRFYFLCGIIGHNEKYCQKQFEGVTKETVRPYGPELRATGRRVQQSTGHRWLLSEPPKRMTNEANTGIPFAEHSCASEHGGISGNKGVAEHYPGVTRSQAETDGMSGALMEEHASAGNLMLSTVSLNTNSEQASFGPTLQDMRKRKMVRSCEEAQNDHLMVDYSLVSIEQKNSLEAGPVYQARLDQ
ncbi:PREDICTED: uncharacterized protein LOC109192285 [Ipomoea nil]|uniref:uncharacterized protein LOC109192285 n=1 Tax=Ipomoea nil TaxID=35883 RepID=UPI000901CFEE|nr:PREDICTED: uncharacterized protein LOC109192285 [Ipomoea nil]